MLVVIESKDNALFKNTRKLKERKYRTKENKYIIEGFRLVQEAFKAKCSIEYLIVNEHGKDKINDYLQEYVDNIKIYELKNELFTQLVSTENTQGIIAVVNINNSIKDIKGDFYLLCDKVQDPGNLGTILRTADSVNLKQIIVTKTTADSYNPKVVRSTMGAILRVKVIETDDLVATLKEIKKNKFKVVVTSLDTNDSVYDIEYNKKVIVIGNEANGVSKEVQAIADNRVKIPMLGKTESLNASVATGIMLYEYVRQKINK